VKEINAAGGLAGRPIAYTATTRRRIREPPRRWRPKAIDENAYVVIGPVFSGSILVSMAETRRAEVPNIIGGEAAAITQQGNPYVFRCSFTQAAAMPKVARYIKDSVKAKTVAVMFVNNDFGKGAATRSSRTSKRKASRSSPTSRRPGQVDFSGAVLKVKQSNADALFVYTNEEESARALRELRKQGTTSRSSANRR
jgi:branched-chain amino acid transport system substrate-binding protein